MQTGHALFTSKDSLTPFFLLGSSQSKSIWLVVSFFEFIGRHRSPVWGIGSGGKHKIRLSVKFLPAIYLTLYASQFEQTVPQNCVNTFSQDIPSISTSTSINTASHFQQQPSLMVSSNLNDQTQISSSTEQQIVLKDKLLTDSLLNEEFPVINVSLVQMKYQSPCKIESIENFSLRSWSVWG